MHKEAAYWDHRYRTGGTSGAGSIGELRAWKWACIQRHAGEIDDVVDAPCGDLSFWSGRTCARYTGIDISQVVVDRNRIARPDWAFICAPLSEPQAGLAAKVVLCLDGLFHVMNEDDFDAALACLRRYSVEFIFIYTWRRNPFPRILWRALLRFGRRSARTLAKNILRSGFKSDGRHQAYHRMDGRLQAFADKGFELVAVEAPERRATGAMYIFKSVGHARASEVD